LAVDFCHVDCALTLRRVYVLFALEVGNRFLHVRCTFTHHARTARPRSNQASNVAALTIAPITPQRYARAAVKTTRAPTMVIWIDSRTDVRG